MSQQRKYRSYVQQFQNQFTQSHASRKQQKEKVAFAQSFQDQTDAVFKHLSNVLKMLNAGDAFEEDIINLTTDMLVDSINLFAKNCHYCVKNRNSDALKLAKKIIIDKWDEFSPKNQRKAGKYYEFLMAAIESKKLIQINEERELTQEERRLQNKALANGKNLNSGFAKVIGSGAKYDKKSARYYEDGYNKQLETEQARRLKQMGQNPKYSKRRQNPNGLRADEDVNEGADSFYFTKSGKGSKFVNAKHRKATDDMDDVLMGGCPNDDDSKSNESPYSETQIELNAVIKLSRKKELGGHRSPSPCLILSKPSRHQSKYHIRMPAPFASEEYRVLPDEFEICFDKTDYVSKVEQEWIAYYKQPPPEPLGYQSIEQQRNPNLYGEDEEDVENEVEMDEGEDEEEEAGINGVIKLSSRNKLGRHKFNTPCEILALPNKTERKFHVRLAAPFRTETHWLSPGKYQVVYRDEEYVAKVEKVWVNHYGQALGYDSIEKKQQQAQYPDTYSI